MEVDGDIPFRAIDGRVAAEPTSRDARLNMLPRVDRDDLLITRRGCAALQLFLGRTASDDRERPVRLSGSHGSKRRGHPPTLACGQQCDDRKADHQDPW